MRHRSWISPLLAVLVLTIGRGALAQVYKWVDANGVTHYDQTPPAAGTAQKLALPAEPPSTASGTGSADWSEADRAFRERQAKRQDAEAKAAAQQAQADAACAAARANAATLEESRRLVRHNAAGEREYLTDDERQQAIAQAEAKVASACS